MKKYRPIFTLCFAIITVFLITIWVLPRYISADAAQSEHEGDPSSTGSGNDLTSHPPLSGDTLFPEDLTGISPTKGTEEYDTEDASVAPDHIPTKEEFFSDALFIGDSRTVGLEDYAELETATFFAYSGLSSFSAFKKTLDVDGVGDTTLDELLTSKHYGKIYLMLGINELGYPLSSIQSQYTHVANRIHELHPHAQILLCANLRVVADGTEKRDYVANDTINQVNAHIASLADNETFFYVDVNPLFDDGNGALDPQYCADDIQPYGKYYYVWGEWLYEVGINK